MIAQLQNSPPISRRGMWYGLIASMSAFVAEGAITFLITWKTGYSGHGHLGPLSETGVHWLLVGITIVLLGVSASGALVSYRYWRSVSGSTDMAHAASLSNEEFISMIGVLCSAIMCVAIIWIGFPLFMISLLARAL